MSLWHYHITRLSAAFPAAIVIAFLLSANPAIATTVGSVRGTVRDETSGVPVAQARIMLTSPGASYGAATDARGFYAIVGIVPATYSLRVEKSGYDAYIDARVGITQDTNLTIDVALTRTGSPRVIATVRARSASFPVQMHQAADVYAIGPVEQTQLGGVPAYENEGLLLNELPGVTAVGGGSSGLTGTFPTIRGGLENDTGYQLDGINATEPLTNEFINNLVLNGAQSVNVTAGPGDASKGGSGSGYVNIVSKTGTYPANGFVQLEDGGPAFEHNLKFELGEATPNHRYSLFASGRYARDFGGCCAPPYGNTWGSRTGAYPDTLGQLNFVTTNDTLVNAIAHFGRDDANTLQIWSEWGANKIAGGYGIDPSTYPFTTNTPAYVGIYQQLPLLLYTQLLGSVPPGTPLPPPPAPLTFAQAQALMPFYPGQQSASAALGTAPYELTNYNLFKIAFARSFGTRAYLNARVYRTQNWVVDQSNDANDPLFSYGLPTVGFGDFYVTRATQNTGAAADVQLAIGERHQVTFGFDYRFSRASLNGTLPSPSFIFGGPTLADFLPVNPFTGAPGQFAGQRYPAMTETIRDPMHRTSFYASDNWSVNDRLTLQPGLRYDLQLVPTAAGRFEANQLQPRFAAVLALGRDRNTVLRAGYGHATTFASLFQIENIYAPPPVYHNFAATMPVCGGPAAQFSAPCADYWDQLYNAWWRGYGIEPYDFARPQQSDSYDLSYERDLGRETGIKLTFFTRRDYDVIVNSQQLTFSPTGAVIPGTTAITNQGRAQTSGLEFQLSRQLAEGLSAQIHATYVNQFVNFVSSNAFRPSVQPALLASGAVFHPQYFSPFSATVSVEWKRNGWRINPIVQYNRGYPIGIWGAPPVFLNGVPVNIPNTNLFSTFGSAFCSYVDPQTPGTPQQPNVVGSTGGGCTKALNGALTHSVAFLNLAISKDITPHVTLGIEVQNLLNNTANYPYFNPGYVNNGFGISGPGSGQNPAFSLPGAASQYPSTPFFTVPSGPGRQITLYSRIKL